jgi:hypothetical protein
VSKPDIRNVSKVPLSHRLLTACYAVLCSLVLASLQRSIGIAGDRIMIRHKFGQSDLTAMAGIARENVNRIRRS